MNSDTNSHRGLLAKTTTEDQGLVKQPVLTPHLRIHDVGDQQILVVSESFNTLLRGGLFCDLLPMMDGTNSLDTIVKALEPEHGFTNVVSSCVSLSARGFVVSADYEMESERAAYWSSMGASPKWAETRLDESRVSVQGQSKDLVRYLEMSGVNVFPQNPDLTAFVCSDFLSEEFAEVNARHLEQKKAWVLVRPQGIEPIFGPVFSGNEEGPCWKCLTHRLSNHQEVHNFLRHIKGNEDAFTSFATNEAFLNSVYGMAASEIAKWLVLQENAPIHQHVISIDGRTSLTNKHYAMRRPQCVVCGDQALHRSDRQPVPLRLNKSPKHNLNSGGFHSVAPEVTLAKYRHLVSPISGVVSWLSRTSDESDSWLHVYWAGSNFGMRSRSLSSLRRSLRSKSAGKGSSREQSEVSALCEAIERQSGATQGTEIRTLKRFEDFSEGEAIHPNEVQLFSDNQLDHAKELNAKGHPYNVVPPRFDVTAEIDWTPVWSFTQERHRFLPTSALYSLPSELRGPHDLIADSNGCAAGNTLEEAIIQGFFELVERDAFAIWWYNKLQVPEVDVTSFNDDYLNGAAEYYNRYDRELWVLDVTSDIEIPTFVALSRRLNSDSEDIIYGAGAHSDPRIATLRAICELNQCLSWLPRPNSGDGKPMIDDPLALWWWKTARISDCEWLVPSKTEPSRKATDYSVNETTDMREDVEICRSKVESRGLEFLVLDQTRPDIGMPVVRVVVPGMRHFWARYAPGRLYDVPVSTGGRSTPLKEHELNPNPVIA